MFFQDTASTRIAKLDWTSVYNFRGGIIGKHIQTLTNICVYQHVSGVVLIKKVN